MEALKEELKDFTVAHANLKMGAEVGAGGFGVVREAMLKGSRVAVKVLHAHRLNRASIKGMLREAHILSQLRHPNVMAFYGAIVEPPTYGFVMAFYPNGSVSDRLV